MDDYSKLKGMNKAATKVQAVYRGHKVREDNKEEIEAIKGKVKVLETYRTDKYMIDQFAVDVKKLRLTLDKFYRICDDNMKKKITTKKFMDQIDAMKIDYTEETKKRLCLVFDEDYNEYITYDDFIDTCDAYGCELPIDLPSEFVSVSKRSLMTLVKRMRKKSVKPDHMFLMKGEKDVSLEDFKHFILNTLN